MLEVSGLRKSYGGRVALNDVSFEAQRGELVGCIGPNGAGKTTLLSIVAGVRKPDAGIVRLDSARPDSVRPESPGPESPGPDGPGVAAFKVGWVPQQQALYGKLSAEENLKLFARLDGVRDVDGEVARMLDRIDLAARSREQVSRLSGGNRQRVNVAVGLLGSPDLLLLDEPSAALDPGQRERLWSLIRSLSLEGTTVLYSTHNVIEAERYADRVLVLADGERVFWGPPGELRAELAEGAAAVDFEEAFVSFLKQRGH